MKSLCVPGWRDWARWIALSTPRAIMHNKRLRKTLYAPMQKTGRISPAGSGGKARPPPAPAPEIIGLYLADLASPSRPSPALSPGRPIAVSTIERRLSGLASSAEVNERHIQKHLGHVSAELARRYQRRRRVNLTKAAGLKALCPSHSPSNGGISRLPAAKTSANRILLSKRLELPR